MFLKFVLKNATIIIMLAVRCIKYVLMYEDAVEINKNLFEQESVSWWNSFKS